MTTAMGTAEGRENDLQRRYQQQAAIADLSQLAVGAADAASLFPKAAECVQSVLGVDVSIIGEFVANNSVQIKTIRGGTSDLATALLPHDIRTRTTIAEARCLCTQVRFEGEPWGFVLAGSQQPRTFEPDELVFIETVATVLQLVAEQRDQPLAREQLARAEAEQALEKLRAVYTITDSMAADSPLGELLGDVLRRLRLTLRIDHASVFLLDHERKTLYLRALEGPGQTGPPPPVRVPLGSGVTGRVAAEGRPMIVNDYSVIDSTRIEGTDQKSLKTTASVMGAPFRIGDAVAGVVMASSQQRRLFTEEELRLLLLTAGRVGPAIERGRLIERIRTGLQRQKSLSRRLLTAQEEERRRIAVELHDELGQALTAVKINLESLARANTPSVTFATMATSIQSVDEALLRVRDLALDLRPSVLDDLGLAAAVRWFVDRFARGGRIEPRLSIGMLPALEPELETACFRVAQEALTNVDRHARAERVWIDLHVLDGALELSVRDDGVGFDVAAARARAISGESVGLLGMQERVTLMGGDYDVVQVPGGGTEVRARFPLAGPTT